MITFNKLTYHTLVKYFYNNFSLDSSNYSILSYIEGKIIEFDFSLIGQILGISSDGDGHFNNTCWSHPILGYHAFVKTISEDDSLG